MAALRRILVAVRLALRSMASHRARTVLTALGISLGVAVVLGVNISNATLMESFDNVFDEAGGKADLTVQARARGGEGFSSNLLQEALNMEGVIAAAPSVQSRSLIADDLSGWQANSNVMGTLSAGSTLLVIGIDPALDPAVREVEIIEGQYLDSGEERYVLLLGESFAEEKGYGLGDDIPLILAGRNAPEEFQVVGIVGNSGAGLINGGSVAFFPIGVAQELMEILPQ